MRQLIQRGVRGLLRFAYPDHDESRRRLARVATVVERLEKDARASARHQTAALKDVAKALGSLPSKGELEAVRRDVTRTRGLLDRQSRVTAKLLRRGAGRGEASADERRVLQRLERLASGNSRIVVGPWMGEVGFELLYWVPFVAWFQQTYDVDPDRLVVVSRGGVSSWYAHVAPRYVDLLAYSSPQEYRDATNLAKKQRGVNRFDLVALRRIVAGEGLGRVRLLHPQYMYKLFWEFWKGRAPARRVRQYTAHAPFRRTAARVAGLPASYVAARFYFSNAFPDTPENRAFVNQVLSSLAEVTDVVLLNTPFRLDDHHDFVLGSHPRIHAVAEMAPERNLAIQTSVIEGARAFVGTYGGYAYLAPLCQVPTVAFHSTDAFFRHHLDLAQQLGRELGLGSLVVLDTRDAGMLRAALSGAAVTWPDTLSADGALKP